MKYQNLFFGKNKKNVISLLSVECAQRVVKVKLSYIRNHHKETSYKGVSVYVFC